ncbi:MAG: hypothetical protein COS92_05565 [Desulfobacterales bacterium CG07_land_8_20_14_0_80_52_14]|nr:MAG: hypothetical protein COX20_06085 [Desulfobacterales bacterium CG23_combo_of_CG06-09_8_20_14_all_52_9]PIU49659.1 MAG: hypothetical protein COS92_05565 [Desulfobacterales bacterium CG07_land_8_20_14_0_80_52_14]
MKQKYQIVKKADKNQMIIQEYAELDKEAYSLLCEETYDMKQVAAAGKTGRQALMDILRTRNLYPVGIYTEKIAETVMELLSSTDKEVAEIAFDDMELISQDRRKEWGFVEEGVEEAAPELDELIEEEEIKEDYDKEVLNGYQPSVQVADEDSLETDEEP